MSELPSLQNLESVEEKLVEASPYETPASIVAAISIPTVLSTVEEKSTVLRTVWVTFRLTLQATFFQSTFGFAHFSVLEEAHSP